MSKKRYGEYGEGVLARIVKPVRLLRILEDARGDAKRKKDLADARNHSTPRDKENEA